MQLITRHPKSLLLVLFAMFVLTACSSAQPVSTALPVETAQPESPKATITTEITSATVPAPTETSIVLPTKTALEEHEAAPVDKSGDEMSELLFADVIAVAANGSDMDYRFSVEIHSPDTGCDQYADWWEVITDDGELIYRRILAHSHVNEQPFTRAGGPVAISAGTVVVVRAHMYPDGYGGAAFRGSVENGFEIIQLEPDFAAGLAQLEPLPSGCAF